MAFLTRTGYQLFFMQAWIWLGLVFSVSAQSSVDDLLKSDEASDIKDLVTGYVDPLVKSFGYGLANGWYNTAKVHEQFGVDLTATANLTYVPDKDFFYNVQALGLKKVELSPNSSSSLPENQVPTVFGPNVSPTYRFTESTSDEFDGPGGLDWQEELGVNFVPVPMVQLGVGVIQNTDLNIRFFPKTNFDDDFTVKMVGFGIKHDVKQWIPRVKELPIELAGFIGFTDISIEADLSDQDIPNSQNQKGVYDINSFTLQGLISRKFSVLTLYAGIGYNTVRSELKLEGDFDIDEDGIYGGDSDEVDPLSLSFAASGARISTGAMIKLAVVTLHADYTFQEYDVLSVGVGIWVK